MQSVRDSILSRWTLGGGLYAVFTSNPMQVEDHEFTFLSNACHTTGQRILLVHHDGTGGQTTEINCAQVERDTLADKVDTACAKYAYVLLGTGSHDYETFATGTPIPAPAPALEPEGATDSSREMPGWAILAASVGLAVVFISGAVLLKK